MKKIVLTGGGTAGHVTPNIALADRLKKEGYEIHYIGSYQGIEKELIEKIGLPYYGISSGKLRRYFDIKNFSDPFKVLKGYREAKKLLKKLSPDIVFSKGGFVAVPVVMAAKKRHIPVVIHESDMTPGLANRLCMKSAEKICYNFVETKNYLPEGKAVHTGTPLRKELFSGNSIKGLKLCGFTANRPVLLVVGGSTGAAVINEAIWNLLPTLLKSFQIAHICGKGKTDDSYQNLEGYKQFSYVAAELKDLFAAADLVVSRAGANVVCELLALRKPNILIPLTAAASRGDQILNAESYERLGYSFLLKEENLTNETLLKAVQEVYKDKDRYLKNMQESKERDAVDMIVHLLEETRLKTSDL